MIVYPLTRWPLEVLRGDEPAILPGMTLSQNISVVLFAGGLAVWLVLRRGVTFSGETAGPSPPVRSPGQFHLDGRRWAWHWHPDGPRAGASRGKTVSGRKDSEGAGRSRST